MSHVVYECVTSQMNKLFRIRKGTVSVRVCVCVCACVCVCVCASVHTGARKCDFESNNIHSLKLQRYINKIKKLADITDVITSTNRVYDHNENDFVKTSVSLCLKNNGFFWDMYYRKSAGCMRERACRCI